MAMKKKDKKAGKKRDELMLETARQLSALQERVTDLEKRMGDAEDVIVGEEEGIGYLGKVLPYTAKALADEIGISPNTLRAWLRDQDYPTEPNGQYLIDVEMAAKVREHFQKGEVDGNGEA